MLILVLSLFLLQPTPQDLTSSQVVDNISRNYARLTSLSAEFEQRLQNSSNQTVQSRGHVDLKKGRRARFVYPDKQEFFDGKNYTQYTPSQKNGTQIDMKRIDDDRLLIFLILGNSESQWKDQFVETATMKVQPQVAGNLVIQLVPRNKDLKDVVVEVDPRNFLIQRFVVTKADGERNDYRFTSIKTNPLPDSLFEFKPGPEDLIVKPK